MYLFLLFLATASLADILPATFYDGADAHVAFVHAGTPANQIPMFINLNDSSSFFWSNVDPSTSATYSVQQGGNDVFHISQPPVRVYFTSIIIPDINFLDIAKGSLGFGRRSQMWRIWSSVTVSSGSLYLDEEHPIFSSITEAEGPGIGCSFNNSGLCVTRGCILGHCYTVVFFGSGAKTSIPTELYSALFTGKNLYDPSILGSFPPIDISLVNPSSPLSPNGCVKKYWESGLRNVQSCRQWSNFTLTLFPSRYIYIPRISPWSVLKGHEMLIQPHADDNSTIYIGASVTRDYLMRFDLVNQIMFLTRHNASKHLSDFHIILIAILAILLTRWVLIDVSLPMERRLASMESSNIIMEATAYGIVLICTASSDLPDVRDDYPLFSALSVAWVVIFMSFALIVIVFYIHSTIVQPRMRGLSKFQINAMRKTCFENSVMMAILLCTIDRRLDLLSTTSSTVVALGLFIFNTASIIVIYHPLSMYHYDRKMESSVHYDTASLVWVAYQFIVIGFEVWIATVCVGIFLGPWLHRLFYFSRGAVPDITIATMIFGVYLSVYFASKIKMFRV